MTRARHIDASALIRKLWHYCNVLRDDEVLRKWLKQQTTSEAQQELIKSISKDVKAGCRSVAARARTTVEQHHFRQRIHDLGTRLSPADRLVEPAGKVGGIAQQWQLELGRWLFHAFEVYGCQCLEEGIKRLRGCSRPFLLVVLSQGLQSQPPGRLIAAIQRSNVLLELR